MTFAPEPWAQDGRLRFPATERNRAAIAGVLGKLLVADRTWRVLELGSGSGEHALYLTQTLRHLLWHPSDPEPAHCRSVQAWADWSRAQGSPLANLAVARRLDVVDPDWGFEADAVVAINLLHVMPWEAGLALLAGSARTLVEQGLLYLYGAFKVGGAYTSASNAAFDASLRATDPRWGLRDLEEVERQANAVGLRLQLCQDMPANNFSVVFARSVTRDPSTT